MQKVLTRVLDQLSLCHCWSGHGSIVVNGITKVKVLSVSLELVGAAGLEPATAGLEIRCSIQLSYAPLSKIYHKLRVEYDAVFLWRLPLHLAWHTSIGCGDWPAF